jgi:hypothetical protein
MQTGRRAALVLPGDPVPARAAALLDDVVDLGQAREFRVCGRFRACRSACARPASAAVDRIAVVRLANLGVTHAIASGDGRSCRTGARRLRRRRAGTAQLRRGAGLRARYSTTRRNARGARARVTAAALGLPHRVRRWRPATSVSARAAVRRAVRHRRARAPARGQRSASTWKPRPCLRSRRRGCCGRRGPCSARQSRHRWLARGLRRDQQRRHIFAPS